MSDEKVLVAGELVTTETVVKADLLIMTAQLIDLLSKLNHKIISDEAILYFSKDNSPINLGGRQYSLVYPPIKVNEMYVFEPVKDQYGPIK